MKILGKGIIKGDEKPMAKGMRRADLFSKMAVVAARRAVESSGIEIEPEDDTMGIIISTQFGPHLTTFSFLDDIIDYSDKETSPTKFSHTVHNAAASYVATALGCRGPISTVTNFKHPYKDALMLAQCWLAEGRVKRVLVGHVETSSAPMEYIQKNIALPGYSDAGIVTGGCFILFEDGNDPEFSIEDYNESPINV
ncbi:MAG: beta-ketoacyl synthase chain length factor [Kiritimatiellae bacterium]|nr:beta-ketoacyl synthase chain length factor [Kiritimatiellia bacterium]